MQKKIKAKVALFLVTIVSSSIIHCSSVQAISNNKSNNTILISTKKQEINNKPIIIKKYLDNDKEIETYNGDLDTIEKYLQEKEAKSNFRKPSYKTRTYSSSGVSEQESKATVKETINYQTETTSHLLSSKFLLAAWGGSTIGTWKGNPNVLTGIVLRQTYTVFGSTYSISLPKLSGGGIASTSKSVTWESKKFTSCISAYAPHSKTMVSTKKFQDTSYTGITVENAADFYIGNTCYKSNTSISKSYSDI